MASRRSFTRLLTLMGVTALLATTLVGSAAAVFPDDTAVHVTVYGQDLLQSQVRAWGWPEGSSVHLSASGASGSYETDAVSQRDPEPGGPAATFADFDMGEFRIQRSYSVTVSGSGHSLSYVVSSVRVDQIDTSADTISGSGVTFDPAVTGPDGGYGVVRVGNPDGTTASREFTVSGSGTWSVSFAGSFDVTRNTQVAVSDWADDGWFLSEVTTFEAGAWDAGGLLVNLDPSSVEVLEGSEFPPGATAAVQVYETPTAGSPAHTGQLTIDASGSGILDPLGYDLVPGNAVRVQYGQPLVLYAEVSVVDLAVTAADTEADTLAGTAPGYSSVWVRPFDPDDDADTCGADYPVVDGTWTVDYAAGDCAGFDLRDGMQVLLALIGDDVLRRIHTLESEVGSTSVAVEFFGDDEAQPVVTAGGWPEGVTVHLTVSDAGAVVVEADAVAVADAGGPTSTAATFDLGDVWVRRGQTLTFTGSGAEVTMVPSEVRIDEIDTDTNVVRGSGASIAPDAPTGPAGGHLAVRVTTGAGGSASLEVEGNADGTWEADFTGLIELDGDTVAVVTDFADEGWFLGALTHHRALPAPAAVEGAPRVQVIPAQDLIVLLDWPEAQQTLVAAAHQIDANTSQGYFDTYLTGTHSGRIEVPVSGDLRIGDTVGVMVTDGPRVIRHFRIQGVTLDPEKVDFETGSVSGTATPGRRVQVTAWDWITGVGASATTTADTAGEWTADLSGHDFGDDVWIDAITPDPAGDHTLVRQRFERQAVTLEEGGTVTMEPDPSQQDYLWVGFTSASGGEALLTKVSVTDADDAGLTVVGGVVLISASDATPENPHRLVLRVSADGLPDGFAIDDLVVWRNGVAVQDCAATDPGISPDPCVSDRRILDDTSAEVTVLTSVASRWMVSAPTPAPAADPSLIVLGGTGAVAPVLAADLEVAAGVVPVRISGASRYETAARTAQTSFVFGADTVYVATGQNFPDALAGSAAAAAHDAPVLLVTPTGVPDAIAEVLVDLAPTTVKVLGGTSAVSEAVLAEIETLTGVTPERISGLDRYATAAAIVADAFPDPADTVYVATGQNFPDALTGSAAAAVQGAPVLLVTSTGVPPVIANELTRLSPSTVKVLGGTSAVSDAVLAEIETLTGVTPERISGPDRYATAVAVVADAFPDPLGSVYVTTGANFPDALAGSAAAAVFGAPVLLTPPDRLPDAVATEVVRLLDTGT